MIIDVDQTKAFVSNTTNKFAQEIISGKTFFIRIDLISSRK